jgi:hypothetical protein
MGYPGLNQGPVIHGDRSLNWREFLFQLNQENPNHQDLNLPKKVDTLEDAAIIRVPLSNDLR